MGLGAIPDTPEEQAKRQKRMARFQEATQPEAIEVSTPLLSLLAAENMSNTKPSSASAHGIMWPHPGTSAWHLPKACQTAGVVQAVLLGDTPPDEVPAASVQVRGTSQALEKPYFRLTAAPDLATVRPPGVLKHALAHVQYHWTQVESSLSFVQTLLSTQPAHSF